MERTGIRRWAKAAAILVFLSAVSAMAVDRHVPKQQPPLLLSLEFAESADEVRQLASPELRGAVSLAQRADNVIFIPSYWALFAATGVVILVSGGTKNRALGIGVIAGITAAAALDYFENAAIAAALEPVTESVSGSPRPWAVGKWLLLFAAAGLVAAAVGSHPKPKPHAILTAVLLGIACASGVAATLFAFQYVPRAVFVMALGLFSLALLWIWSPMYLARTS